MHLLIFRNTGVMHEIADSMSGQMTDILTACCTTEERGGLRLLKKDGDRL